MREYYQNNKEQREKNNVRGKKRALRKISCTHCDKLITIINMKQHVKVKHPSNYSISFITGYLIDSLYDIYEYLNWTGA